MLKAELHSHAAEDRCESIRLPYTARQLIAHAAALKYDLLSLTFHHNPPDLKALAPYAKKKGVTLIPGLECFIEGRHTLVYNLQWEQYKRLRTFDDLERVKDQAVVVAAHPFYPFCDSLMEKLEPHIRLFDGIEWCHRYWGPVGFNGAAAALARKHKLPLLGTGDVHDLRTMGYTYTLLDCDPTPDSFAEAVRRKRLKLVTRPLPFALFTELSAMSVVRHAQIRLGLASPAAQQQFRRLQKFRDPGHWQRGASPGQARGRT